MGRDTGSRSMRQDAAAPPPKLARRPPAPAPRFQSRPPQVATAPQTVPSSARPGPARGGSGRPGRSSPHPAAGWNSARTRPFPDGSGMPCVTLERRARRRGMPAGRHGVARSPDVAECRRLAVSPLRQFAPAVAHCALALSFWNRPAWPSPSVNPMRAPTNRPVVKSMAGRSAGREQGSAPRSGRTMRGADGRTGNAGKRLRLPLPGKTGTEDGAPPVRGKVYVKRRGRCGCAPAGQTGWLAPHPVYYPVPAPAVSPRRPRPSSPSPGRRARSRRRRRSRSR